MKTYIVMVRILGGEWERHKVDGVDYETPDLAEAIGMKETISDPIREVMVVGLNTHWLKTEEGIAIAKQYELVE